MKTCTECLIEKPLEDFYVDKRVKKSVGRSAKCKDCCRFIGRKNVREETPEQRETRIARAKEYEKTYRPNVIEGNKLYIRTYLETHPCVDCGEDDWVVLEFDHVRGEKDRAISALIRWKLERIIEEIAKCDVRCANCHRRITYLRANNWRISEKSA